MIASSGNCSDGGTFLQKGSLFPPPATEGFKMVQGLVRYPGAGCVVEFMQGNAPQIAWVLEEQNGRLRLLLPNRRETALQAARILPWPGPAYEKNCSRDAAPVSYTHLF